MSAEFTPFDRDTLIAFWDVIYTVPGELFAFEELADLEWFPFDCVEAREELDLLTLTGNLDAPL